MKLHKLGGDEVRPNGQIVNQKRWTYQKMKRAA